MKHVTIDEEGCCCVLCIQLGEGLIGLDSKGLKLEEDIGGLGKVRGLELEEDTGGISMEKGFGCLVHIICTQIKRLKLYYTICSKLY